LVTTQMPDPRVLCFHKHRTSARTRFLSYGASVLSGAALPPDARLQEIPGAVRPHPAQPLLALEARMGLAGVESPGEGEAGALAQGQLSQSRQSVIDDICYVSQ